MVGDPIKVLPRDPGAGPRLGCRRLTRGLGFDQREGLLEGPFLFGGPLLLGELFLFGGPDMFRAVGTVG
ncbi:hypothetical protein [Streptomyces sp. LN785]|uniref:hypothetical protein n=1 Tax=Streptomyces sp. LN785 TaxID=3112983 RepID=UPI003710C95B